jgi:Ca-activated chloride channel family protein
LKTLFFILVFISFQIIVSAQKFYFRGEVQDEAGNPLPNVTVQPQKTGYLFKTGASGTFGIVLENSTDTLSFSLEGYLKLTCLPVQITISASSLRKCHRLP